MPLAAIRTETLTRSFKGTLAVDHVDLEVAQGEVFGLVGPNGAGKTTLIRIVCGLIRPTSGTAWVLGHDVSKDPDGVRRHIGYMSQAFSLYQELTVGESLRFYSDVYGSVSSARMHEVISIVGLDDADLTFTVAELSTGTRQRAALAAAVLHDPELVILDEPTSGVDPVGRRDFWKLVRLLAENGTTVLTSTHVMPDAARCDRVALLADGRLIACGSPVDLCRATGSVIAVIEAEPWQRAYEQLKGRWPGTTLRGQTIRVPLPVGCDPSSVLTPMLAGIRLQKLDMTQQLGFEDAFAWYMRRMSGHAA
jgi:ABC-2 type transport system ATP-binding protein